MPVELYSAAEPAVFRRTITASIALMAGAMALAVGLTQSRGEGQLGERYRPAGWSVSFRPPARFKLDRSGSMRSPSVVRFVRSSRDGVAAALTIQHAALPVGTDPAVVCRDVVEQQVDMLRRMFDSRRIARPAPAWVGPLEGAELTNAEETLIVRAAVQPSGKAYVISLDVARGPISASRSGLFDMVCESVEFHDD